MRCLARSYHAKKEFLMKFLSRLDNSLKQPQISSGGCVCKAYVPADKKGCGCLTPMLRLPGAQEVPKEGHFNHNCLVQYLMLSVEGESLQPQIYGWICDDAIKQNNCLSEGARQRPNF